jgi:prolipoprotein diacylglyceryltransferase
MYPNLFFFLRDALGIDPPVFTRYINSFGLLVAIAFIIAAFYLRSELKRKEKEGLLQSTEEKILVGKPASPVELILNFIFGFFVGYKIIGVFTNGNEVNPQEYIFSSQGNILGGLFLGLLFSGLKYVEKKKQVLVKPEERKVKIWPHERVGDITVYAALAGFLGAKLFDNLENWDRFIQDPIGNLLSPSGLTFYGGLILATIVILIFARSKKIGIRHLVDSAAPALMIAYAIGRMGCHVAGDGDWGVFNSAFKVNENQQIVPAADWEFHNALMNNGEYTRSLVSEYGHLDSIPHIRFEGFSFLPNWFWAYNYPHNVNEVGVTISGCEGEYCSQLSPPVFPTPLYEIITCLILFFILWRLRKRIVVPGRLFALYLVFNGFERFFIEKIRVNTTYDFAGFHPTQAELISVFLILTGMFLWFRFGKLHLKISQ